MTVSWKSQSNVVAKYLASVWWQCEADEFRRTPMSGAWDKKKFPSDIVSPPDFPLAVEIKMLEAFDFNAILNQKADGGSANRIFRDFVCQVVSDGVASGKVPVLLISKNRRPYHLGIPFPLWIQLKPLHSLPTLIISTPETDRWVFTEFATKSAMNHMDPSPWTQRVPKELLISTVEQHMDELLAWTEKVSSKLRRKNSDDIAAKFESDTGIRTRTGMARAKISNHRAGTRQTNRGGRKRAV